MACGDATGSCPDLSSGSGAQLGPTYGAAREPRTFGKWGKLNETKMVISVQGSDGMIECIPDGSSSDHTFADFGSLATPDSEKVESYFSPPLVFSLFQSSRVDLLSLFLFPLILRFLPFTYADVLVLSHCRACVADPSHALI